MKNIHIVNKIIATSSGVSLKTVEAVNKIYWKEIVKNLTAVDDQDIHIKKLGTIEASPYKVRKQILKNIEQIKKLKISPKYKEETKEKAIAYLKEGLTKLLKKRNQHAIYFKTKYENDRRVS